jgi:16S rRNA (cytosine967-C5)-methyltransferase
MKKNERRLALSILESLLQERIPLSYLLKNPEVTPLCQEICYGVCRHYIQLQILADKLVNKRPKELKIWLILLIGLYQLHFLRIPDYAVVKETVSLLDTIKKPWAKGLVNAVLRNFCRQQQKLMAELQNQTFFKANHPPWLVKRFKQDWPESWEKIVAENDKHPPMTLRNNVKIVSRERYLQQLNTVAIGAEPHLFAEQGIILAEPIPVEDLPGFAQGEVSVQDAAAQLAVSLLDLKPELKVLDACCAPGGKTCHMLELESSLKVIGLDVDKQRLDRVQSNLNRLHLHAVLKVADALSPQEWWDGILFDRILLDAPCSAIGVIRRHPDIKLLRSEEDISRAAILQRKLLDALWPLLAPKGILVYATCSIMMEENEYQMKQFFLDHKDAKFRSQSYPWGRETGHGWQVLPGDAQMDGFFYSVIYKS